MNQPEFIESIRKSFETGLELIKLKNNDYGGPVDPFKNFHLSEMIGVPIERAILVRISDKLARISNILDIKASVKNETIEDTLLDLINYAAILKAYLESKKL